MVGFHHTFQTGIGGQIKRNPDHDVMAVAEVVEDNSKSDSLMDLPSQTPQLLGLLVDVAVDQP
eukprot:11901753-Prorocentrum_lima.AAC.1